MSINSVSLKPFPFPRELSMEAYLIEHPEVLALDDDELATVSIIDAEVPLIGGRESRSTDGRIDLLALYGSGTIGVIELKLGDLTERHLRQLEDYLLQRSALREIAQKETAESDSRFVGLLVGSGIESTLAAKIRDGYLVDDEVAIAALTIGRYRGDDNDVYIVTDTYFRNVSRSYDRTKYRFLGDAFGKSRLVLAVIRDYVSRHSDATFADLESAFPRRLQGSKGCFASRSDAEEILESTAHKRHFVAPDEVLKLSDGPICVCNQWGMRNIEKFLERTRELGYDVEALR